MSHPAPATLSFIKPTCCSPGQSLPFFPCNLKSNRKQAFSRWGQESLHSFTAALSWFNKDPAYPPVQATAAECGRAHASMRPSLQSVRQFPASCGLWKAVQEHRLVSKGRSGDNPAQKLSLLHVFNFLPIRRIWSSEECSSILVPLLVLHEILRVLTFIATHLTEALIRFNCYNYLSPFSSFCACFGLNY